MAALPSPTQVAGHHSAVYEAYYAQVDPNGCGTVGAMDAARFLKRSGLSDVVLSRVWDLSDPTGRGSLDKAGFFVALKLVAIAQTGKDVSMANVGAELPPPRMGDRLPTVARPGKPPPPAAAAPVPAVAAPVAVVPAAPLITSLPPSAAGDWAIKPAEREKYDRLFDSLQPHNGMIPGNKVKGVLMESKLPLETLGKIWDLADMDKDGMLDRHEFVVAMHLVYKALEKYAIPNVLPPELAPPPRKLLDGMRPVKPPQPVQAAPVPAQVQVAAPPAPVPQPVQVTAPQADPWVVSADQRARFDVLFTKSDVDRDGYVSGLEIKDVFLKSGAPQPVLAHIWALCDIKQSGKLNGEQFALAMWLVERFLEGTEPPVSLAPDMVPPSFRNNKAALVENNNTPYSNPELDMISKDIEELAKEKLSLETDIAQKEADIKVKSGEIKSLQSELDTLAATLKQLENQKGEAQKRLNDLKTQRSALGDELRDVDLALHTERQQVDKLRSQADEQAEVLRAQETELLSKKEQLESLRREEERLEQQRLDSDGQLHRLTGCLQDTQLQISQAKAKITQLQEQQRQMSDAISACDAAIQAGDAAAVPDAALRVQPEFRDAQFSASNGLPPPARDPFAGDEPAAAGPAAAGSPPFGDDPFKPDPFKAAGAFNSDDLFEAAFPDNNNKTNDAFGAADPFDGAFGAPAAPAAPSAPAAKPDPFDPFGDGQGRGAAEPASRTAADDEKDPFGCDPFAILHAPTRDGRAASPGPALPPKKSKQPPPRPAPPRPVQPPRPAPPTAHKDPFSANAPADDPFAAGAGAGGFANFADFDSKFSGKLSAPPEASKPGGAGGGSMDFADDPFRDYRYEDPFNISDPFEDEPAEPAGCRSTEQLDAFGFASFAPDRPGAAPDGRQSVPLPATSALLAAAAGGSGRLSAPPAEPLPSEDQQLAWAAAESLRLEEARRRQQRQEQADLEFAIALSKADSGRAAPCT